MFKTLSMHVSLVRFSLIFEHDVGFFSGSIFVMPPDEPSTVFFVSGLSEALLMFCLLKLATSSVLLTGDLSVGLFGEIMLAFVAAPDVSLIFVLPSATLWFAVVGDDLPSFTTFLSKLTADGGGFSLSLAGFKLNEFMRPELG